MVDRGATAEEATAANGGCPAEPPPASPLETLEQRVARLEDAVAALQDTDRIEQRVTERVTRRLSRKAPPVAEPAPADLLVNVGRQLLPAALSSIPSGTAAADVPPSGARPWVLFEAYAEARAMVRMFFDRRYRVSWTACIIPVGALIIFLFSWLILGSIPLIGWLLDKTVDLVLAFVIYKVLGREVQRYRQTIAGLPPGEARPPAIILPAPTEQRT